MSEMRYTGGCLCGALRYEAIGEPRGQGYCYCVDCQKASGSGFIPFLSFNSRAVQFVGDARQFRSLAASGREAVRNFCPICSGLVFGGEVGISESHTVYAGTLDDTSLFRPTMAIFTRSRPSWALTPAGLTQFEAMPG